MCRHTMTELGKVTGNRNISETTGEKGQIATEHRLGQEWSSSSERYTTMDQSLRLTKKEQNWLPTILYTAEVSFKSERRNKDLQRKSKRVSNTTLDKIVVSSNKPKLRLRPDIMASPQIARILVRFTKYWLLKKSC